MTTKKNEPTDPRIIAAANEIQLRDMLILIQSESRSCAEYYAEANQLSALLAQKKEIKLVQSGEMKPQTMVLQEEQQQQDLMRRRDELIRSFGGTAKNLVGLAANFDKIMVAMFPNPNGNKPA